MELRKKKYLYSLIQIIAVIAITFSIFKYIVVPIHIKGISMENTLHDGSVVLMNSVGVSKENIHRFDIIVADSEAFGERIIKRVIGLPGDTVECRNDVLYINGEVVEQDFLDPEYVEKAKITYNSQFFTNDFVKTVGENQYFVMGDNRLKSTDSRLGFMVEFEDIVACKGVVVYPFNSIKWLQ